MDDQGITAGEAFLKIDDLDPLRNDPEWQAELKRLAAAWFAESAEFRAAWEAKWKCPFPRTFEDLERAALNFTKDPQFAFSGTYTAGQARAMLEAWLFDRRFEAPAAKASEPLAEREQRMQPVGPRSPADQEATPDEYHSRDDIHSGWQIEAGAFHFRGQRYELAGKPLDLLRVFLSAREHRYLGYDDLRAAWEDGDDPSEETIRVHLLKLRKTLRDVCSEHEVDCADPLPLQRAAGWRLAMPRL